MKHEVYMYNYQILTHGGHVRAHTRTHTHMHTHTLDSNTTHAVGSLTDNSDYSHQAQPGWQDVGRQVQTTRKPFLH